MKSLYRQNLLKSGWVMVDSEEVRVIDSNKAIEEKITFSENMEKDASEAVTYRPVSFDEEGSVSESPVDLLFSEGIEASEISAEQAGIAQEKLQEAYAQAEEIIAQAHAQAEEIMSQARIMSEQEARAEYERAGKQGMQDGYQQGLEKANREAEVLRQEYESKAQELQRQYDEKLEEMEPYLTREIAGVFEHVFDVELSQYRNILQHLITNTLRTVEMSSSYLIHVSEQDYSYVSMQKPQIIEEGYIKNARLEIVEDRTLGKNECLIETEDGIFDCSLSVQLAELKKKLQLLSYTGKKE